MRPCDRAPLFKEIQTQPKQIFEMIRTDIRQCVGRYLSEMMQDLCFMFHTHTFLWFLLDDPQLSTTAKELIVEPTCDIEVSSATY